MPGAAAKAEANARVLLEYARLTGSKRIAFFRSDTAVGLQHLENFQRLCQELGLELAGPQPTRESFVQGLYKAGSLDIADLRARFTPGEHRGLKLAELSIYRYEKNDRRFRH